jgi:hypothetical protein
MILKHFRRLGHRVAGFTWMHARGRASSMTDQAIRAAVDQGARVLEVAAEQVRSRGVGASPVELGVTLSMGLVELNMRTIVAADAPTSEPSGQIEPAFPDSLG